MFGLVPFKDATVGVQTRQLNEPGGILHGTILQPNLNDTEGLLRRDRDPSDNR